MTSPCSDDLEWIEKNRTFFVDVNPRVLIGTDVNRRVPAHRLVIEPIVSKATEMRIYGLTAQRRLHDEVLTLGVKRRGHIEFDLSQEVVRGHEAVWNATSWDRGAIVLAAMLDDDEIAEIFHWCDGPGFWSSLYQLKKGTPASAIKYAYSVAAQGSIAFSFSASNGIQWMDVFPPAHDTIRMFHIAKKRCRPFKRFIEHNTGNDEIIVDRMPYQETI